MQSYSFTATECRMQKEEFEGGGPDVYTLGLADKGPDPEHYVILQQSSEQDEQDAAPGMDEAYFVSSFFEGNGCGVVQSYSLEPGRLVLYFTREHAPAIGYDTVEVRFAEAVVDHQALHDFLGATIGIPLA